MTQYGITVDLSTDILGEPWVARRLPVAESDAAPGADHAVLVHQREAAPATGGRPRHERAVLYFHGRSDYFFQTHVAQAFLNAGYEFYALELRSCGRAGVGHRSPHDVRDLRVHDEEIKQALDIIRTEHGHSAVVLNGHSTGGLQAVIWAGDHPGTVDAVTLNSPWLDLNASAFWRSYGSAFTDLLARWDPDRIISNPDEAKAARKAAKAARSRAREDTGIPAPTGPEDSGAEAAPPTGAGSQEAADAVGAAGAVGAPEDPEAVDIYVRALHRRWGGEWDWDLSLKPVPSSPVRAGFLAGIRRLHRDVHHGLGIEAPVLLCCSTDSTGAGATLDEALRSDVVLSVPQMLARAPFLGDDVTVRQIPGGVHDLALSPEPARSEYLDAVTDWLRAHLG
ncbi:alpha/beta hydrolase [Actinomyces oricola]